MDRYTDRGSAAVNAGRHATPTTAADQYLVRVQAAGLNFLDTLFVKGRYQAKPALHFTLGVEVVGTIVGEPGAGGMAAGTRVAGASPTGHFGGFAQ